MAYGEPRPQFVVGPRLLPPLFVRALRPAPFALRRHSTESSAPFKYPVSGTVNSSG